MMQIQVGDIINSNWKVEKLFNDSGQGQSAIVFNELLGEKGVIKALKNCENSVCVKRFKREITLLTKMEIVSRVPSIYEANEEKNYYIMEYIEGNDLESAVSNKRNRRNFDKIMTAFMTLLEIVGQYSKIGIVHRDIKPANILCKGGDIEDIYLIDFGIAYDEALDQNFTEFGEQLGNRFLRLPELLNGAKHDIRSDITFCVGILFYMITNMKPTNLIDERGEKPHQRVDGIEKLQWVGTRNLTILNRIFDKGFNLKMEERFQSIDDLVFALNEVNMVQINKKSRYLKKTDSYCLSTIKEMFDTKYKDRGMAYRKLKSYENRRVAIGNANLRELDGKWFITLDEFDLIEKTSVYHKYSSANYYGLFIRDKIIDNQISLSAFDSKFELTSRMTIKNNMLNFSEYSLKNYTYEIPVERLLEPIYRIDVNEKKLDIIINKDKLVVMRDWIEIYDMNKASDVPEKINIDNLVSKGDWYSVSNNLKWMAYECSGTIRIAELVGKGYVEKNICSIEELNWEKCVDCKFCGEKLLILFKNKLVVASLVDDTISELDIPRCVIRRKKIVEFDAVSEIGNYCYLNTKKDEKIYVDLLKNEINIQGYEYKYNKIIKSRNTKYIYSSSYDKIYKRNIENGSISKLIELDHLHKKYISIRDIECEYYDYFFGIEDNLRERQLGGKNKIAVWKIIDGSFAKLCNIEDEGDIYKLWISGGHLVSASANNQIVIWKING